MEEALEMVKVTGSVRDALIHRTGELAPVLEMIMHYENANWQEVSRRLIIADMDMESISEAYQTALRWYKELMFGKK